MSEERCDVRGMGRTFFRRFSWPPFICKQKHRSGPLRGTSCTLQTSDIIINQ